MQSLLKTSRLISLTIFLFILSTSIGFTDEKNSNANLATDMSAMMNPAMYMNMMNPMMGMMNPMMGMMNPMSMGGMSNPMNMMNPMMGMMGPMMGMGMPMMGSMMNPMSMGGMSNPMNMMNPMMGGMNMPYSSGANTNSTNQMMDPKQYEQWFSQWTEMMKNFTPPAQTETQ